MTTTGGDVENENNGFGYGQLDPNRSNMGSNKNILGCGFLSNLSLCTSYLGLGKHEVLKKVKERANEYRIGIFILIILILVCFFVLLHLSLQVGAGIKTQNNNGKR